MKLDINTKDISVHYNLGGATNGHLRLFMMNTKYTTLSNAPYVRPMQPGLLLIPNNATRVASYELKKDYGDNF